MQYNKDRIDEGDEGEKASENVICYRDVISLSKKRPLGS